MELKEIVEQEALQVIEEAFEEVFVKDDDANVVTIEDCKSMMRLMYIEGYGAGIKYSTTRYLAMQNNGGGTARGSL